MAVRALLAAAVLFVVTVAAARAGGPGLVVGVTEDAVKQPTIPAAKAQLELARLVGFAAVRVSEVWSPGERAPSAASLRPLERVAAAAQLTGTRILLSILNYGSRTTPLTAEERAQFAAFGAATVRDLPSVREVIVGNEPNLNRYWLPQFAPDGSDAAAVAYEALLAQTYDALKRVSPRVIVLGGALAPRGSDDPTNPRQTHSPTRFILDLGAAYRASGRARPLMDEFAFHPYDDNSSIPPLDDAHPRTTSISLADYAKLVALLAQAFDGTAQAGSTLPIVFDEFGIESQIPPRFAHLYTGHEPPTTKPVPEPTQAAYYRQAVQLAFCDRNVRALFLFHTRDERDLAGWQSGVYYVNEVAKQSLPGVRSAIRQSRGGVVARCPGMQLVPRITTLRFPSGTTGKTHLAVSVGCNIDCTVTAVLLRVGRSIPARTNRGTVLAGSTRTFRFDSRGIAAGRFRISLTLRAPVNPGPALRRTSRVFSFNP